MTAKNREELKKYLFLLLAVREYSRFELEIKLAKFSDDTILIQEILDEFKHNNWQSDVRFAENFIASKRLKCGSLKLIYELKNKGISEKIFSPLLPDKESEIFTALEVLNKKFKIRENSIAAKRKYFCFLNSKGFESELIYAAIKLFITKSCD